MAPLFHCAAILLMAMEINTYSEDKTGKIDVIIPKAVFDDRTVEPDNMISISGSLDKKSSPPVVRVSHLQK